MGAALGLAGCSEPDGSPAACRPSPRSRESSSPSRPWEMPPSSRVCRPSAVSGWHSRGGEIVLKDQPIRSLDELADADLLIFPGQQLGNLVDADVLETVANQAVLASPALGRRAVKPGPSSSRQRSLRPTPSSTPTSFPCFATR